MQHEGMVHALEEIHRLLKPGGILVDIRPLIEAPLTEVHQEGRILFALPNPDYSAEDYRQADKSLAQVIRRGLFVVERGGQFDFLVYGSTLAELRDYLDEQSAFAGGGEDEDEAATARRAARAARIEENLRDAGAGAEVATHERTRITRLRAIG